MKYHRKIKHNEKVGRAHDFGSYAQSQGRNQVRGQNRVSAINEKTAEANLTKLHRKIEQNKKICRLQRPRSRSQPGQRSNCAEICVSHILLNQI